MNVKEYISSGILEDYLLGNASDKEQREVNCLSSIYPEIQAALEERAEELGLISEHYSVEPPTELKAEILSAIENEEQDEEGTSKETKVEPLPLEQPPVDDGFTPSIDKPQRTNRVMWIGVAASLIILIIASWAFFNMDHAYQGQIADLEEENQQLEQQINQLAESNNEMVRYLASPSVHKVPLSAVEEGSGQNAIVFWDEEQNEVLLNSNGLQDPPEGKQYQLWALKDGQPIDLGVFDKKAESALTSMQNIASADAFAITLEKEGGVPQPTMEQLQVMGEVKG